MLKIHKFNDKIIISIFLMKRKYTYKNTKSVIRKRKYKKRKRKTIRKKRLKYKKITRLGRKWIKYMEKFMLSVQE